MLVLNTQLDSTNIVSLQTGGMLGAVSGIIIDPRKLQIVAFYVSGALGPGKNVLHISDIREFGPLGFIIDTVDDIMPLDDSLVRLQEVISLNFSLLGKQVVTEQNKILGKVIEYVIETGGFYVQKIHVSQSLLKNFSNSNLIIHRSQIVELSDKRIIVRSATVQEPVGLVKALNPFKKPTQPLAPETTKLEEN